MTEILLMFGLLTRLLSVGLLIYVIIQMVAQFKTHSFVQYLKPILLAIGVVALVSNIVPIISYIEVLQGERIGDYLANWGRGLNSLESLVVSVALYFIYRTAKNR